MFGYWVAGPYPEDLSKNCPPELRYGSLEPVVAANDTQSPNWQAVPLNPAGFLNLGSLFNHAEHISAYALVRIYSPQQQRAAILLGSDDQVTLWLHDKLIHERLLERPAIPDDDAAPADLEAGWNTLLARVNNITGSHALYLRLSFAPADLLRADTDAKDK